MKWQLTLVLLPGKSYGQRSLVGYHPWGHKESDTTDLLHFFHCMPSSALSMRNFVLFFSFAVVP